MEPMPAPPTRVTLLSPGPSPTSAVCPLTPVPFEPLPAYPTREGVRPDPVVVLTQVLPPGVTLPESAEDSSVGGTPAEAFYLVGQKRIGRYYVREWEHPILGWGIVTISTGSEILVQIEFPRLSVKHAGQGGVG